MEVGEGRDVVTVNYRRDKGPSDFDVPHRFVTSFIWELPFFNSGGGARRSAAGN
ncbi:MAG: hypothetical protein ACKV2V_05930 [Blastocatellia bacterium]